ncbi:MAG: bifunctional UDP-N-acetylglucosamine diphosphorylase/glucosamine-1-phosphate N-acetyltransferase GlmU [Clostridiales bacterium]|nr:bifunctional UDP-N-acetylglucosamine diphosphorylase/glucosamine-1-phosphate N-acetyltransferase GlmU [Clostridiales bacterium]
MDRACALILAAGDGKRMKSRCPKALCEVLFKPMLSWVTDSCRAAEIREICAVIAPDADAVAAVLPPGCETAIQEEKLGTGHAVMMAEGFLRRHRGDSVLVLYGDAPFVDRDTICAAYAEHTGEGNDLTVVSARLEDPTGYGRILRDENGDLLAIVEQRDADEKTRMIQEVNSGIYWFRVEFLLDALNKLGTDNAQGEYYLTDTVGIAVAEGRRAGIYRAESPDVILGANTRSDLARLNEIARRRVLERQLDAGVSIPFPETVVICPDTVIGPDTVVLPGCILRGCTIGSGCTIGPYSVLTGCRVEDAARVEQSTGEESSVGPGARVGPYARLRPGSRLGPGVKVGNFVEIKNSTLGERTSVAHLSYLGDSDVGREVNVGCGVVTANYDGREKFRTRIGDRAFIGCNTNFIAPVSAGEGSVIAAGTTVTEDVPSDALAVGRAPQVVKPGWALRSGKYKRDTHQTGQKNKEEK